MGLRLTLVVAKLEKRIFIVEKDGVEGRGVGS
jgi:hypothetical protein